MLRWISHPGESDLCSFGDTKSQGCDAESLVLTEKQWNQSEGREDAHEEEDPGHVKWVVEVKTHKCSNDIAIAWLK